MKCVSVCTSNSSSSMYYAIGKLVRYLQMHLGHSRNILCRFTWYSDATFTAFLPLWSRCRNFRWNWGKEVRRRHAINEQFRGVNTRMFGLGRDQKHFIVVNSVWPSFKIVLQITIECLLCLLKRNSVYDCNFRSPPIKVTDLKHLHSCKIYKRKLQI